MHWIDKELLFLIAKKDHLYKTAANSGDDKSSRSLLAILTSQRCVKR